jgi:transcription elongation factor GreA
MGASPHFDRACVPSEDGLRARLPRRDLGAMVRPTARETAGDSSGGSMNERLITAAGLARLRDELERLRTSGRSEIAERLRHAVSTEADPSTNADYLEAREEQARLEARIARLEDRLATARLVEPDDANGTVDIGERVRLRDLDTGSKVEYELVGSFEGDPAAGRISAESPVGRALIGRRAGEIAVAQAPKGEVRFRIVAIEAA